MRFTFEWVDQRKQIALPVWVGLIQSIEGLNTTKRIRMGGSSYLADLSQNISLFLPSDLNWTINSSWASSLLAFRLELTLLAFLGL